MAGREGKPLDFHVLQLNKSGFKGECEMSPATFIVPSIFLMENLLPQSTKVRFLFFFNILFLKSIVYVLTF